MTLSAMALGIVAAIPSPARADNPFVQTYYTADPAPMVHEGTLYVYTSHDEDVSVNNFYTMNDWRLYSTTDMVNWRDHGSVASYRSFSWGTGDAWAPQGIARNGKYYLYVPLNNATGARIGVGVSDNVAGPFMDPLGKELAVAPGGGNIDPTVFIDDDGQAHMYWGNGTLRHVRLNSDMISTSGSITTVPLNGFTEGPWVYKRGSLYYLVYAGMAGTEKISYATSNSPTGPWTVRGDIMGAGRTYTNHAGIVDYKGHSYFFYHNSALPGGGDFKRSVCVEEFTYGADGSIPRISMTTEGPAAIATLDPFKQVEAETIAFSSGLKTEVCTDTGGGLNVTSINNGDYIKVKNVDFLDGVTSFEARVSSAAGDAKIELRLDSQNGTLLGTCDVSGASAWTTKTCAVTGGSGKHDLFLKFVGGNGDLFKFNWWRFTGPTVPDGEGGGGGGGGTTEPGAGGAGGEGQGTGGSAGAEGTTSGSGGSVAGGTGGSAGTAGSGSGGSTGSSDGNGATGADPDGSCACRAGTSAGGGGLAASIGLVASALVLRRRRR
ncbi:glycoside hydrolase family 43 protein [Sorangium sp. So ce315]|uniref:glycoside hydrolase family 43 protein n=1 Tax=Sorangium sp. So ce315 TaxID=3133299 RepID=UPI003F619B77